MRAHQAEFPIATMCRVPGVSTSGFYWWLSRPPSDRLVEHAWLTHRIYEIHKESRGTYGSPRVHAELQDDGWSVGLNRVVPDFEGRTLRL